MFRPFQLFQQRGDVVVGLARAQAHCARRDTKRGSRLRLADLCQPKAQQVVDYHLEGFAAATHFLLQEHCNVVVNRKCRSHITMLTMSAS